MAVQGTWNIGGRNLPDYGLTELLRQIAGKTSSAEVTTRYNNPLAVPTAQPRPGTNMQKVLGASTSSNRPLQTGSGIAAARLGVDPNTFSQPSSNGGGSGGQPTEKPSGSPDGGTNYAQRMADLAEQQRRSRIDSTKMQGKNLRDSGQRTFDDLLKSIGSFRERAGTLKQNAGQEIIDTASNILGSNAATAQDLAGKATGRARGLGLGLSSRINLGNDVLRQLQTTQGNTIAERGQQERANDAQFQERQDQAQDQENTANTYRKGINDQATTLENMGYSNAEDDFSSALNNIVNYQQQMAQLQPLQVGGLQGYQPDFSGIANTLNGVLSGMEGGGQPQTQDFANPVNPTNYLELLRQRGLVQ